jgi:hypothetical protein
MTKSYFHHCIGLAVLACLMLVPGLANAACPITTSILGNAPGAPTNYGVVQQAGNTVYVTVSTPAGCLWEAQSHVAWMRIVSANHGYGSGTIAVQVLPNPSSAVRRGTFGAPAACGETIAGRSSVTCAASYTITIDQY